MPNPDGSLTAAEWRDMPRQIKALKNWLNGRQPLRKAQQMTGKKLSAAIMAQTKNLQTVFNAVTNECSQTPLRHDDYAQPDLIVEDSALGPYSPQTPAALFLTRGRGSEVNSIHAKALQTGATTEEDGGGRYGYAHHTPQGIVVKPLCDRQDLRCTCEICRDARVRTGFD